MWKEDGPLPEGLFQEFNIRTVQDDVIFIA